jgi:cysteine desulfurase/selenocysteine lyase
MTTAITPSTTRPFDVQQVRAQFPALHQQVHGKPLVYLDNAATSHKPQAVIHVLDHYSRTSNSHVHRGLHTLSELATGRYEEARRKVARYIGAAVPEQIIFTRGTTEAINLVAQSWGRTHLGPGDEILLTTMEHHSNIVPWQLIAGQTGAKIVVAPVSDRGELDLDEFEKLLSERTKIVAVVHVSNALGTVNPVKRIVELVHRAGAVVLIDGAQAVTHMRVDVKDLGAEFYAFSGHKCFGPTGIGVLYGKEKLLDAMPPSQGGGEMIESVSFAQTTYADIPHRFEAGTPNIAGAIGLGAAIDFMAGLDYDAAMTHEHDVLAYGMQRLAEVPGLTLIGTAPAKSAVLSFVIDRIHPYDMAPVLDHAGVAIRTGHHCTQPLMERFGLSATVRASLALYNTRQEIDTLIQGLAKVRELFAE